MRNESVLLKQRKLSYRLSASAIHLHITYFMRSVRQSTISIHLNTCASLTTKKMYASGLSQGNIANVWHSYTLKEHLVHTHIQIH